MTTFRSSVVAGAMILVGCSEERRREKTLPPSTDYEIQLTRDGKATNIDDLVRDFERNPNAFELANEKAEFVVTGKIASIGKYNEVLDPISGFHIPLRVADGMTESIRQMGGRGEVVADGATVFVKDFTKQTAAQLTKGETITVKCPEVDVVNRSVVFRECVEGR